MVSGGCSSIWSGDMALPVLQGLIRRRILLNYRADPEVVRALLPERFRPKIWRGYAVVGICLIRLEEIRPKGMPALLGVASENVAHRMAVEWEDEDGTPREGVFIPRRDTGSRLNAWAGGRVFPGVHHLSRFQVEDEGGRIRLRVEADDSEEALVSLVAKECAQWPEGSIFGSLEESSRFFEAGCLGHSARPTSCTLDGLLLKVEEWRVAPLHVEELRSAYFEDLSIFPEGSIQYDHALIMRDIAHEWVSEESMDRNEM